MLGSNLSLTLFGIGVWHSALCGLCRFQSLYFCALSRAIRHFSKHGSKLKQLMSVAWHWLSNRVAVDPIAKFNAHMMFANLFIQFNVHKKIPLQVSQ